MHNTSPFLRFSGTIYPHPKGALLETPTFAVDPVPRSCFVHLKTKVGGDSPYTSPRWDNLVLPYGPILHGLCQLIFKV